MMTAQKVVITDALLEMGRTKEGGWTEAQLALLWVSWPLRPGWKKALVKAKRWISTERAEKFVEMGGGKLDWKTYTVVRDRPVKKVQARIPRGQIETLMEQTCTLAQSRMLEFSCSTFHAGSKKGKGESYHFMFDFDGRRVLDWWPTSGTWWSPTDREKGKSTDYIHVVNLACRIAASL